MPKPIDRRPLAYRIGASGNFRMFLNRLPKQGRSADLETLAAALSDAVRIHLLRETRRAIRFAPGDPLCAPRLRNGRRLGVARYAFGHPNPRPLP